MKNQLLSQSVNFGGQTIEGPLKGAKGQPIENLGQLVSRVLEFLVPFAGVILLFVLIWGGFDYMMSQGNPEKINNGKSYILYAIIGLLLAIFGFVFIQVIAIDILHIPGFK